MWAARARTWRPRSPHGSRLGYLPWLISCGLFRLNPRVWGDAPTIPTTTKRSYHHLEILKHQHHNNEYNTDNNNLKNTIPKKDLFFLPTSTKVAFNTSSPRLILQAIHLSPIILVFRGLLGVVSHWTPDLSPPNFTKSSQFQKNWRTCLLPSQKLGWGHLWLSPAALTSRLRIYRNCRYPTSAPG